MFQVGQRVVCIRDAIDIDAVFGERLPSKGVTYTIRGIDAEQPDGFLGLWLEEIINKKHHYVEGFRECSFDERGFRPVVERNTDISIFTALLNPSPQKVRESIGYDLGFTAEEIGLS